MNAAGRAVVHDRDGELTRRQRKARALSLLQRRDLEALRVWAGREASALEFLMQLVSHGDVLVRWRAVEGLGIAAEVRAAHSEEVVRERLRRLLWSMNHESGNLIWMAPDAAGEILARVPPLAAEFSRLIASFINLEPFVEGVHRAVARIAGVDPAPVAYLAPYLAFAITRPEAAVRAHGALALGRIDPSRLDSIREALSQDDAPLEIYDRLSGELVQTTVERLVVAEHV
jgi:HEAT repeat protein